MTRNKALRNIPKPDEEKLRALYQAPAQVSPREPSQDTPGTQDYVSTSNQVYEGTSPQGYVSASPHVYKQTNLLVDKSTSPPPGPPSYQPFHQPVPPGPPTPQGVSSPAAAHESQQFPRKRSTADLYRRQTYHLRPDQVERIRAEAFHTRRKISEVLRDIIDQYYRAKGEL